MRKHLFHGMTNFVYLLFFDETQKKFSQYQSLAISRDDRNTVENINACNFTMTVMYVVVVVSSECFYDDSHHRMM